MSHDIVISNLTKRFPKIKRYREMLLHPFSREEVTVLDDINLQVKKGELFGLLGPNGAGKTTLLKILATLVLPTTGQVSVMGRDVRTSHAEVKKDIGYVLSEERSFYWRLTVRQNLKFFATLNNMSGSQAARRIDELIEIVGLHKEIDKVFQTLSSGMKQKAAIARGLLTNPNILLLDEPTRTLDPIVTLNLRTFFKSVIVEKLGKTVVLATNNMHEAEEICERIAIINNGKVILCEYTDEVRRRLKGKETIRVEFKGNDHGFKMSDCYSLLKERIVDIQPLASENGKCSVMLEVDPDTDETSEIIKIFINNNIRVTSVVREEISLTEVFKRVI